MSDLVKELRDFECQDMAASNANTIESLMRRAADEIERLRSLADAVTPGPSASDIKRQCDAVDAPA